MAPVSSNTVPASRLASGDRQLAYWLVALVALSGAIFAVIASGLAWGSVPVPFATVIAFASLVTVHAALYWFSRHVCKTPARTLVYCAAQAGLVVATGIVSQNFFVVLCLVTAWGAETATVIAEGRFARRAVAAAVGLFVVTYSFVDGPARTASVVVVIGSAWLLVQVVLRARRTVVNRKLATLVADLG